LIVTFDRGITGKRRTQGWNGRKDDKKLIASAEPEVKRREGLQLRAVPRAREAHKRFMVDTSGKGRKKEHSELPRGGHGIETNLKGAGGGQKERMGILKHSRLRDATIVGGKCQGKERAGKLED